MLIGGSIGFIAGIIFGEIAGNNKGPRSILVQRQRGLFIWGFILGFVNPMLATLGAQWTGFLPIWLNALLWTAIVGFILGLCMGYWMGRAFLITLNYSRHPNVGHGGPSLLLAMVATILGLAAYLFLFPKE